MQIVKKAQAIVDLNQKVENAASRITHLKHIKESKRKVKLYVENKDDVMARYGYEELWLEIPSDTLIDLAMEYLKEQLTEKQLKLYKHIANDAK